jgi:hypothetical protein
MTQVERDNRLRDCLVHVLQPLSRRLVAGPEDYRHNPLLPQTTIPANADAVYGNGALDVPPRGP